MSAKENKRNLWTQFWTAHFGTGSGFAKSAYARERRAEQRKRAQFRNKP